ncbi:MAG: molybdopterin-dependent oxidoreductase, partial [Actinomycetia bacterium]|nr:molybdopterin-dependent oxidoreductase [Actinomycetes bacterium]
MTFGRKRATIRGVPVTPNPNAARTVVGSCPLDCPDACAWLVTVDAEGHATKLRGNPDHPYTRGGLCPKVNPWLENAADPSRLTQPLRRVGAKGEGRFEPVSWEDALAEMAERLQVVIDRSGGAAIWPYVGTGNLGWVQGSNGPGRVWTRMGASAHHLSICSAGGREGIGYTVGTGAWMDAEDFARAGLVLIWGSNTLVTNRHLWPFVEQARQNGAPVVVIDPIRTRTAERADTHLALRPGTDGALALGLCRAIVDQGGADKAFLEERCLGWDEFRASLDGWDLETTTAVTGIAASDIEALAAAIIAAPPLALRVGHGLQRQAHGGQAMRVVSCVPAMVGAYNQRGGGSLYSSSGSPKGYNLDLSRRPALGVRPRTLTMTNLGWNLTELDDPPVEALVVYGANPLVSNPQLDLVRTGLERDDLFTVVIDIYPTETTAYADLVLPSAMQHEQLEINDAYNHHYLHWNEPSVDPPGECLPHTEIFRRLAAAMGYEQPELFATDEELAADLLDSVPLRAAGITPERLGAAGFLRLPEPPDPAQRQFLTPSGRFELTSEPAAGAGQGRLPHYRAPAEATGPGLALIAAASEHHVNSTFAGTALTLARASMPPLVLHPTDAEQLGLTNGDRVVVENDRGSFPAVLSVSDSTRRGVANTTKGWWGHGLNNTVPERDADMGQG